MVLYGFVTIGLDMEDMNMAACNMAVLDVYLSFAAELIGITAVVGANHNFPALFCWTSETCWHVILNSCHSCHSDVR